MRRMVLAIAVLAGEPLADHPGLCRRQRRDCHWQPVVAMMRTREHQATMLQRMEIAKADTYQ
jgi:hypothetical protein